MPAVYISDVIGTGAMRDPFRTSLSTLTTQGYSVLMIDNVARKAIVLADQVGLDSPDVTQLVGAATRAALKTKAQSTGPNAAARARLNTWAANAGYPQIPANLTTWWQIISAAAKVVNPAADLDNTGVGE